MRIEVEVDYCYDEHFVRFAYKYGNYFRNWIHRTQYDLEIFDSFPGIGSVIKDYGRCLAADELRQYFNKLWC